MNTQQEGPGNERPDTQEQPHLSPTMTAFFIGFLVGIVIYSVAVNSWGFLTLIPLYMIYRLVKKPGDGQ